MVKACKNCRLIVTEGTQCPLCQSVDLVDKFSGQLVVIDPEKSEIGKRLDVKAPGRYAIKLREKS